MKNKIITILGILFIITGIIICILPKKKENKNQNTNEQTIESTYKYLSLEKKDKNIIYSPLSINTAFSMLNEGAQGETKKELDKLFSKFKVNNYKTSEDLSFANSIFINEKYKNEIKDSYVKLLQDKYYSELIYDTFETPEKINNWVSDKTFGLIEQILDSISPDSRLALVNALAINTKWKQQFDEENTYEDSFYLKNGDEITISMMHNTYSNDAASYYKSDDISAIKLELEPINDINFEFLAIMPNDIDNYINELSNEKINEITNKLVNSNEDKKLKLSFPKFKYDYKLDLINDLRNLGVKKVFTPFAELGEIGEDLYVTQAVHKATIELTEKGSKASAATVIVLEKNAISSDEFVNIEFNKPFIFIIRDKQTNNVWFVGKVINPKVEE